MIPNVRCSGPNGPARSLRPIDLSLGEPGYPPPSEAVTAALVALHSGRVGYAPPGGLPALRELIARNVGAAAGVAVDAAEVLVTAGASMGLYAALAALLSPGETVMCPNPGYPHYAALARTLGGRPRYYELTREALFAHDVEALERVLPPSPCIVIWNSPANPVGSVAGVVITQQLVELAERRGLWLVSDEAYGELTYERRHCSPLAIGRSERVVMVSSFSKSHALSGWRVGYALVPPRLYHRAETAHWTAAMSPATPSQYAALGALQAGTPYLTALRAKLRACRDLAVGALRESGVPVALPQGAFFLWIDVRGTGYTSEQFCRVCWERTQVAISPGAAFGPSGEGFVRVSFAAAEDLVEEAIERLGWLYRSMTSGHAGDVGSIGRTSPLDPSGEKR